MKEWLKKLVTHNRGTKLVAILVGLIAWHYFNDQISVNGQVIVRIVVDAQGVSDRAWLLSREEDLVYKVRVYGPKQALARLGQQTVTLKLTPGALSDTPGDYPMTIRQRITSFDEQPPGITIVDDPPQEALIRVDSIREVELPVKILATDDKWIYTPSPPLVWVRGPRSIVEKMNSVKTWPVKPEDLDPENPSKVGFEEIQVAGRDLTFKPNSIGVAIKEKGVPEERIFKKVKVWTFLGPKFDQEYEVEFENDAELAILTLRMPQDVEIKKNQIEAFVRFPNDDLDLTLTTPQDVVVEFRYNHEAREKIEEVGAQPVVRVTIKKRN